jgi:sugar diacid utilization regulator
MTTAVTKALEQKHPWFLYLSAAERSWITLVAGAGIDGFINWLAADSPAIHPTRIFDAAPRIMARRINLKQSVDLVRTTVEVVREQLDVLMPPSDRALLSHAVTQYSAEVAFATAEVYAKEAESRGAWDEHIEAVVIDALVRADPDGIMLSQASTLEWPVSSATFVMVGSEQENVEHAIAQLRLLARHENLSVLVASHGHRMMVTVAMPAPYKDGDQMAAATALAPRFGDGAVVLGSVCAGLASATHSATDALSGALVAHAWANCPRLVYAQLLLPERALAGNTAAREELVETVYRPLVAAGSDLLNTLIAFFATGGSIEATARTLFVHPNTVRYRIKRIAEVTCYSPTDPRDAFTLQIATTLGRLTLLS